MTHPENPAGRPGPDRPDPAGSDAHRPDADGAPLDAAWRAAAEHYNAPPPVPADAMWAAIQARRGRAPAGAPPAPAAAPAAPDVIDVREARELRVTRLPRGRLVRERAAWRWAPAAAAAALLFGVGIGVGRQTAPRAPADAPPVVAAAPAGRTPAAPGTADPRDGSNAATPQPAPAAVAAGRAGAASPAPAARGAAAPATPTRVARADVSPPRGPAGPTPPPPTGAVASVADAAPAGASAPLRAATEQHLARVEALLTTFATHDAGGAGAVDARGAPDAAWARDLLTTTRLLLDSPAGEEPGRRALLERLELVLGQIARLPSANTAGERALIDQAIRRGDLMSRLRTAVPAGAPAPASGS